MEMTFVDDSDLTPRKGTDILYLRLLNDDMVVLSSNKAISELVDKRSGIYADRVSDSGHFTFHF